MCHELIIKLDEHSRKHAFEWDTSDRVTGSAAAGSFTTDGTARIHIAMEFDDFQNQTKTLRVSTTAILCAGFQWDLFPTRWFQNLGHSVIFEGVASLQAPMNSGNVSVQINQLLNEDANRQPPHRNPLGHLNLTQWNNLTFFPYSLEPPEPGVVGAQPPHRVREFIVGAVAGARGAGHHERPAADAVTVGPHGPRGLAGAALAARSSSSRSNRSLLLDARPASGGRRRRCAA